MLANSKLPVTFWAEAVNTACHVLNRVLTVKRHNKTCYEFLNNRKPNLDYLLPFGNPCTMLMVRDVPTKFSAKDIEGIFLGRALLSVIGCAIEVPSALSVSVAFAETARCDHPKLLMICVSATLSVDAAEKPIRNNFGLQQIRLSAADLFFSRRTNRVLMSLLAILKIALLEHLIFCPLTSVRVNSFFSAL
ncbi:hypothetical protein L1987_70935 [Smallanthus sonchifolius]|uniref:Uncharacterized protein n=1 Tax=Smallanthus sonchifolius TaxID=185202 RepID=A0ACB9ARP6_9ASTR|nr:hypothetical protein L1987_70935 [Smallanthus sonchifolius]